MRELGRSWTVLLAQGIVTVVFGITALVWPGLTLMALIVLFGVFSLVAGAAALYGALQAGRRGERWTELTLVGATYLLVALVCLFAPALTEVALVFLVAAWAIIGGVFQALTGIRMYRDDREWLLFASGVLSIVFGAVLLSRPAAGMLAMVWVLGIFAIVEGAMLIGLALRLRRFVRRIEAVA